MNNIHRTLRLGNTATDAPGHNIGLMSTGGDLEVGVVRAGNVEATWKIEEGVK